MSFNRAILWILFVALAIGCRAKDERPAEPPRDLPVHRLIYGGDVFFGRGINDALFNDKARDQLFGDVAPLLKQADLALINGEGVISRGGFLFNKGEPRPFLFRAHPSLVDVLKDAGVDIVSVGNNHACDYGPEALLEMLHRLRKAGIDYTGGGAHIGDARTPSFHRIRDTVVAVVGADLTLAHACRARERRPGVLFFDRRAQAGPRADDRLVDDLKTVIQKARRYADLVFFTPHWGDNGKLAPTDETRRLARRLVGAGMDAIIGHSAHRFHGVEIIDGVPVIYDAGNLLDDMGGARAMLWELWFTKKGVTEIVGRPLQLKRNQVNLAKGKVGAQILDALKKRSQHLGTRVSATTGVARVSCHPRRDAAQKTRPSPPRRPVPRQIQSAPTDLIREAMPPDVTKVDVVYPNGITLVGYKLFTDALYIPKAGQVVELFFRSDRRLPNSLKVHLEAVKTTGRGRNIDRHIPGDWLMPTDRWPEGKIITDRKLFRLKFTAEGTVAFSMALFDKAVIKPVKSSLPVDEKGLVSLGSATYEPDAKRIHHYIQKIVQERMRMARRQAAGKQVEDGDVARPIGN